MYVNKILDKIKLLSSSLYNKNSIAVSSGLFFFNVRRNILLNNSRLTHSLSEWINEYRKFPKYPDTQIVVITLKFELGGSTIG